MGCLINNNIITFLSLRNAHLIVAWVRMQRYILCSLSKSVTSVTKNCIQPQFYMVQFILTKIFLICFIKHWSHIVAQHLNHTFYLYICLTCIHHNAIKSLLWLLEIMIAHLFICSSELAPCGSLNCGPSRQPVHVMWFKWVERFRSSFGSINIISNSSYRFIEGNYIAINIVIELSPSPNSSLKIIATWLLIRIPIDHKAYCRWSQPKSRVNSDVEQIAL